MRGPGSSAAKGLAGAVGLALGLLAAMLWWMGGQTTKAQALGGESSLSPGDPIPNLRYDAVGPAWGSTVPVSRAISVLEMSTILVWPIPQYGVTVTFPAGWLGPLASDVVMTFTPELAAPLPAPVSPTSYFFDLRGVYALGGEVSLSKAITVEVKLDQPGLGPAIESSLRAFFSCCNQTNWVAIETRNGSSQIDLAADIFRLITKSLGHVGVGGYHSQSFLPIVLRPATAAGGLDVMLEP